MQALSFRPRNKDYFVCCPVCGKKLFKARDGSGVIVMKCRGCRKEVVVPFGEFLKEKDGKNKNK